MIAVTGASGRLGGRVARRLAQVGCPQRLIVRQPDAAPDLRLAEVAVTHYDDGPASVRALEGVETLLMVSARESAERVAHHRIFVDAAASSGVRHVVYTSFYGAASDAVFTFARDHWATEQYIRASGLGFTFLRNNLYLDLLPFIAGPDGVIRGPAGDGRISAVALDDIADATSAVLLDPGVHAGATYDLTGPEELSLTEAAAQLTAVTERAVTYEEEPWSRPTRPAPRTGLPTGSSKAGSAPTWR